MSRRQPTSELDQEAIPTPAFYASSGVQSPRNDLPTIISPSDADAGPGPPPLILSVATTTLKSPPVKFSWQARQAREKLARELREAQVPLPHEATFSGEQRSLRSTATPALPTASTASDVEPDCNNVFEDGVDPLIIESDVSGSDAEFEPEITPLARVPRKALPPNDTPKSPERLTAKEKGKTKQIATLPGPSELPPSTDYTESKGRLPQVAITSFREFGQATRLRGQELADFHHVNLATVMRHASLGAGSETRASSACNTFKSIFSAETFAETGGMFFSPFRHQSSLTFF